MKIVRVIAAISLLILSSKIEIDAGLSYLSFSLQSLIVVLLCPLLGPAKTIVVITIYLLLGWAGLPVFSSSPGGAELLQSAGLGYLIAFLPASLLPGVYKTWWRSMAEMLLSHICILICGAVGLILALSVPVLPAIRDGALVFLPGALIKSALAATFLWAVSKYHSPTHLPS